MTETEIEVDVYPVGLFSDWRRRRVRYGLSSFLWAYCIKGRRWRSARNYFNGYLAEHRHGGHNAGRGWTKRAALRRVNRICAATPPAPESATEASACVEGGDGL